jgi:transposase-like protein
MTAPPGAPARDELRRQVRELIGQGLSNRAIARHPGMPSRDTVRRWRTQAATAHSDTSPDAPPSAPPGPGPCATTSEPAPPGADQLTLDTDADLREDLAILAEAGHTPEHAVMYAVQLLADAYRTAWDYADVPRGTRPQVRTQITGTHPVHTPHRTPGGARQ